MGYLKELRELWQNPTPDLISIQKERLISWRREPTTIRIERPTRIDRARSLGYKAKQGIILVRQRVSRGGRQRGGNIKGRRSKTMRRKKIVDITYQTVAEQRAAKRYPNCEVLNSYEVGKDGLFYWFEIILLDRNHPQILADKRFKNVAQMKGRAERGLTSSAKISRGLTRKGVGAELHRPSLGANKRKH
ncbi:MAG: 50S ribosomal protein L15e [Candidatus Woesearchaeota archaeon]